MSELVYEESSATYTVLWEDIPIEELREYILSRHLSEDAARHGRAPHNGAVKVQTDQPAMPDSFRRFAANTFADLDIFEWQYWTGYYDRECPPGQPNFVSGMPHAHGWDGSRHAQYKLGHTLVMYVQVPERGGELVVMPEFRDNKNMGPQHELAPAVGVGAVIEGNVAHGVRPVHGDTPRLACIATAFTSTKED